RRSATSGEQSRHDGGAAPRLRVDVELVRHALNRAEPGPRRSGGGVAVAQRLRHARDAGSAIDRDQFHTPAAVFAEGAHEDAAAVGRVLDQIRGQFGRDNACAIRVGFVKPGRASTLARSSTHGGRLAPLDDGTDAMLGLRHYFHRVMTTFVPSPSTDEIENSFDSRFAPDSPSPKPPPVVNPSRIASAMSGMQVVIT